MRSILPALARGHAVPFAWTVLFEPDGLEDATTPLGLGADALSPVTATESLTDTVLLLPLRHRRPHRGSCAHARSSQRALRGLTA